MSAEPVLASPDFADVYAEQLVPVWRYVSSRVRGSDEAQDLTSEVFTRAWRSWPGFDPRRGSAGAWIFRIAQRTVVDAIRRPATPFCELGDDAIERAAGEAETPEAVVLRQELLQQLRGALTGLEDRERDGLALRFAAGLKMHEIGQVLGLSTGATKMMISRSITKLADALARGQRQRAAAGVVLLDEVIDDVLERGHPTFSDGELRELVLHLAAVHRPELPADLPGRVQSCVACAGAAVAASAPDSKLTAPLKRLGQTSFLGLGWLPLAPVCLACTIPALVAPLLATGMSLEMAYGLHALSLATAPIVFFLLWRHYRRHRDGFALWVGGSGALLLVSHLVVHFFAPGVPMYSMVADQAGTVLLVLGTGLDLRSTRRWLADQRRRLATTRWTPLLVAPAGQR